MQVKVKLILRVNDLIITKDYYITITLFLAAMLLKTSRL
jgi:hypothetical protein